MTTTPLKTRFAPSPSGLLHLGNLRTALFNALLARSADGRFLLRIEDTDADRSEERYVDALQHDLQWLGLDWQEGPGAEAHSGPYRQSLREAMYQSLFQRLLSEGHAYHCFCSDDELKRARERQRAAGKPPRYAGTCAGIPREQAESRIEAGEPATLRFRVPPGKQIVFQDLVRGEQRFASNDLGDFIIRRADGSAAFLFCNAVDDSAMQVSQVLRGEDHLTNTPRQCLVLDAIGLPRPQWGHLPMILGEDGAPLSKRNGSRSVQELRDSGILPAALLNYLARLGHADNDHGLKDLQGLAATFRLDQIGRAPARYDEQQLLHWQELALRALSPDALQQWMQSAAVDLIPADRMVAFTEVLAPNVRLFADVRRWARACFSAELAHDEATTAVFRDAGSPFFAAAADAADQDWAALTAVVQQQTGARGRGLFLPLRLALTGERHGPELAPLHAMMGPAMVRARFAQAAGLALSNQ